jgi:AcrR family transcriptional regulator
LTHRHEQAQSAIRKVFSNEDSAAAAPADPSGRRERAKAANREAILAAARRTFAELGYEASTVRDIIRRTDLASGTFYNYFRSKEEVYDALADDSARRFRPILRAAREQTEGFEDYLRLALRAYFQFLVDENRGGPNPVSDRRPNAHADTPEMMAVFAEVRESLDDAIARGLARSSANPSANHRLPVRDSFFRRARHETSRAGSEVHCDVWPALGSPKFPDRGDARATGRVIPVEHFAGFR